MRKTAATLLLLTIPFLACSSASAEVLKKEVPQPPPAQRIHPGVLNVAVRTALASGAEYLLSNVESNYLNYAAPPKTTRTRKIIGYEKQEQYSVRYRWEEYEHPIYKHIYEEYETFVVGGSHSVAARKMGKVKRKRVVGTKQVGTTTAKRLVADPKGGVVRTYTRNVGPIYEGVKGPEYWTDHLPGDNALALLALLKSGVPEEDERLQKLAVALNDYVTYYGTSDLTWNVAWLAAALSNLRGDQYRKARELSISRILDGQIFVGPARGMWGPVCINMEMLPVLVKHETEMGQRLAELKADLPKKLAKTTNKKKHTQYYEDIERAEEYVKSLERLYRPVTQQGLRFNSVQNWYRLRQNTWETDVRYTPGLPYYIYNQALADLESTAIALYAISEAAANGCLPEGTMVPDLSGSKILTSTGGRRLGSVVKPQKPSGMLARASAIVSKLQKQDGSWDQCNMLQETRSFESMGLPRLPLEERFKGLPSARTRVTSAQGYSCLANAGKAVGISRLFRKYGRNIMAARKKVVDDAASYLDRKSENVMPEGRVLAPYDLYFAMLGVHRSVYPTVEDQRDLWMRFAHEIVETQHDTGVWNKRPDGGWPVKDRRLHSSSLWVWKPLSLKAKHDQAERAKANNPKPAPFNLKAYWSGAWYGYMAGRHHHQTEAFDREIVATALSMLFLADGVYPPIGGYMDMTGNTPPPGILDRLCAFLKSKHRVSATSLKLTPENIRVAISSVPLVFLAGPEALADSSVSYVLKVYIRDKDGVLIVETKTPEEQATVESKLKSIVSGSVVKKVPDTADFLADYQGPKPEMKGLFAKDGRLAVLFTTAWAPPAGPATAPRRPPVQYGQAVYLLVKKLMGPEYFDPKYPSLYIGEDPFVARVAALSTLRNLQLMPERAKATAPKPGKPGTAAPAASLAPAPVGEEVVPDDEQW